MTVRTPVALALQPRQLVREKRSVVDLVFDQVEEHAANRLLALTAVLAFLLEHRLGMGFEKCNGRRMRLIERRGDGRQVRCRFGGFSPTRPGFRRVLLPATSCRVVSQSTPTSMPPPRPGGPGSAGRTRCPDRSGLGAASRSTGDRLQNLLPRLGDLIEHL